MDKPTYIHDLLGYTDPETGRTLAQAYIDRKRVVDDSFLQMFLNAERDYLERNGLEVPPSPLPPRMTPASPKDDFWRSKAPKNG